MSNQNIQISKLTINRLIVDIKELIKESIT